MDINAPIQYEWKLGWDREGMSQPRPIVKPLLKAIIEKDVDRMEQLFGKGARLEKANKQTLERVVFHILDDYNVVKWMTRHGFQGFYGAFEGFRCVGVDGYFWDLLARAWYLEKYDVFELVAAYGFNYGISYCIGGEAWDVDKLIVAQGDVRAAKILLEYGFRREYLERCIERYPQSAVSRYLRDNPVVKRKIGSLDDMRYRTINYPYMKKPGLFHRKKVIKKNEELLLDYNDRVDAQKKLKAYLGEARWEKIMREQKEGDELFSMIARDMLNE